MISFWRRQIAGQLTFAVFLTMMITFIAVGILAYQYMAGLTMDNLRHENILRAESISKDISYNIESTRLIVQQMAINRQLVRFLETAQNREDILSSPQYDDVLKTLQGVYSSSAMFNIAWVASEQGSYYIENNGYISDENYVISKRPWHDAAKASQEASFSKPYLDYGTDNVVISCVQPIRQDRQVIGYVAVDLVLDRLPEYFAKYKIGSKGENFLIAGDGTYIYHDDKTKIMVGNILQSQGDLQAIGSKIIADPTKSGFEEITYRDTSYYLAYYPTQSNGWVVGLLINKKEALHRLREVALLTIGLCALAVVLMMLTVHQILQQLTLPFGAISHYAAEIAEGDFSKNLPEEYLARQDEMGELARSFQIITDAFRNENQVLGEKVHEAEVSLEKQYSYILETEKMASLGTLVAGVAHEINTPLGVGLSLSSYLSELNQKYRGLLQKGEMGKADLQRFMEDLDTSLHLMEDNLSRAAEMVKSFKQVAVDQSSEMVADFFPAETVKTLIMSLRHEYKRMDCKFDLRCPEDLKVRSYPGALTQILSNLVINSIRHGFKDRPEGNIRIDISAIGRELKIIYQDDGAGIAPENLKRIYDPFFTTARQAGSSGLGMNIVYNLVHQKLHGDIQCHSQLGQGVEFVIDITLEGGLSDEG